MGCKVLLSFVNYQVLSGHVDSALKDQGRPDTQGTIKLVEMIDKVFDCMNVSRKGQDRKGKKELREYSSVNDWRFKVCLFQCTLKEQNFFCVKVNQRHNLE